MLYIFAWEFSSYFVGGVGYALFSLHTSLPIMSEALYPGLWNLEIEELCRKIGQMYVLTQVCENSS